MTTSGTTRAKASDASGRAIARGRASDERHGAVELGGGAGAMGGPADGRAMRDPDRHGIVDGVQIGRPEVWDPKKHLTGMRKQPVVSIDVADPGAREAGGRSGVAGDHVGDLEHHGGSEQAVYVVARQELEHWERELGRSLPDGAFGENVTTRGIDVDDAVIGTRWRMGSALLEVTGPRIPCRTFAWALDEPRWVRRFTERGRSGAYVRVIEPGTISAGDAVEVVDIPEHGVTVVEVFRAYTGGGREVIERVVAARVLAPRYQGELEAKLR